MLLVRVCTVTVSMLQSIHIKCCVRSSTPHAARRTPQGRPRLMMAPYFSPAMARPDVVAAGCYQQYTVFATRNSKTDHDLFSCCLVETRACAPLVLEPTDCGKGWGPARTNRSVGRVLLFGAVFFYPDDLNDVVNCKPLF